MEILTKMNNPKEARLKLSALKDNFRDMTSVIIAYSGGVDSAFMANVANDVLGVKALAITAKSPSLAKSELREAVLLGEKLGLNHRVIETEEVQRLDYRANTSNRCFYCKDELYDRLANIARTENFSWIANGTNADDLKDFRPGLNAAKKYSVRSPLVEVGLSKSEIRLLSKEMGLSVWDKPAQACLSSRVPYGTTVTVEALESISVAEEHLRNLGISQIRVRHHGNMARIEIEPKDFHILVDEGVRNNVIKFFKSIGYIYITLDLAGFRSGSLNEVMVDLNGVD